jgi:preprotein translocase subunit SecY
VKPGSKTAEYIDFVVSRITLPGAIFLTFIALMPTLIGNWINAPFQFGGTSLLIVVGVALDMAQMRSTYSWEVRRVPRSDAFGSEVGRNRGF